MSSIIFYSTKKGFGKKVSGYIASESADIVEIIDQKDYDTENYNNVIFVSSVYAGQMKKGFKDFFNKVAENKKENQKFYFVMVAGQEENYKKFFNDNLPDKEKYIDDFFYAGYSYDFEKMNFFEKFIIKKIVKIDKSKEDFRKENLDSLVKKIG
ncbi:MAG TPA: flavodoxin domain-containing protein [Tepiditoga sp.]|nr:hypothetical protein [Thermotogota bacterium]HOO74299.1 flavodoxin domain-containing protein [Tepiditoga sp.]